MFVLPLAFEELFGHHRTCRNASLEVDVSISLMGYGIPGPDGVHFESCLYYVACVHVCLNKFRVLCFANSCCIRAVCC